MALDLQMVMSLKDEVTDKLEGIKGGLGGVDLKAVALGGAATLAVGALAKGIWDCAQAAADEEVGIVKLTTSVNNSGASWDAVGNEIEDYIAKAQRRTAFDDGDQRQSLTNLTNATGDYKRAMDLQNIAMDLARARGMDLVAASELVGKVANGNTGILARYGIVIRDGATASEALAAMQEKFAGQADAYGKTNAAATELMRQQWGNLKETIGAAVLPILTMLMSSLADLVASFIPPVQAAIEALRPVFEVVFAAVSAAIQLAWSLIQPLFLAFSAWLTGPGTEDTQGWGTELQDIFTAVQTLIQTVMPIIQGIIETVWGAISGFIQDNSNTIKGIITTAWGMIQTAIDTTLGTIRGIILTVTALINGDWQGAWDGIKLIVTTVWDGMQRYIDGVLTLIKRILSLGWEAIKTFTEPAWNGIKKMILDPVDSAKRGLETTVDGIRIALGTGWNTIHNAASNAWNAIRRDIETPFNAARDTVSGVIDGIKKMFTDFAGFHIPMPHFNLGWHWDSILGISVQVPNIDIAWYRQGLAPTVFNQPTLIGVGEAGPEEVTVRPLGSGSSGGSSGGSGATYQLTYIDQRAGGDEMNILRMFRLMELEKRLSPGGA